MGKHNNSEIQKKEIRKKLGLPPNNPATNSSKNKGKFPSLHIDFIQLKKK